jgi:hypothetical protein
MSFGDQIICLKVLTKLLDVLLMEVLNVEPIIQNRDEACLYVFL